MVIRLNHTFPAAGVAQQLELSNIRPVLVSNELGEILGQAFPERGVLFGFEPSEIPGKATMRVVQIILEPISAEPFVLRAETLLNSRPEFSASDLEQAVRLDPSNGRARWLLARVLAGMGELAAAEAGTLLTNHRIITIGQNRYEFMCKRTFGRCNNFLHCGIWLAVTNIDRYRIIKGYHILRYHTDLVS